MRDVGCSDAYLFEAWLLVGVALFHGRLFQCFEAAKLGGWPISRHLRLRLLAQRVNSGRHSTIEHLLLHHLHLRHHHAHHWVAASTMGYLSICCIMKFMASGWASCGGYPPGDIGTEYSRPSRPVGWVGGCRVGGGCTISLWGLSACSMRDRFRYSSEITEGLLKESSCWSMRYLNLISNVQHQGSVEPGLPLSERRRFGGLAERTADFFGGEPAEAILNVLYFLPQLLDFRGVVRLGWPMGGAAEELGSGGAHGHAFESVDRGVPLDFQKVDLLLEEGRLPFELFLHSLEERRLLLGRPDHVALVPQQLSV